MDFKKTIGLILFVFLAACSSPQAGQPDELVQTTTVTPNLEPTTLPSSTPSPTPSPTLPPPTATPPPLERLTFKSVIDVPGGNDMAAIFFANRDGSGLVSPSLFEPFNDTFFNTLNYLAWSPDGRFLAFDGADSRLCEYSGPSCYHLSYGTYVADNSQNAIIQYVEGALTNASWSPDSQNLVLSIEKEAPDRDEIGDLVVLNVKSGEIKPLTLDPASDLYPSWSPDGQWIAFVRFDPDPDLGCFSFPVKYGEEQCHQGSLYRIRPDGSDLQLLYEPVFINNSIENQTVGIGSQHDAPAWSPDGHWLAFLTSNINEEKYPDISILNVETGEWQLVTGDRETERNPAWSPDGQKLAFSSREDGNSDIYVWDMQEKSVTNLTWSQLVAESKPVWSSSGDYIAFFSSIKIWVMDADGTNKVLISDESAHSRPVWQPSPLTAGSAPTALPAPTSPPSKTLPVATATPPPLERITFTVAKDVPGGHSASTIISFVNSDGSGLESPTLFESFSHTYGSTGKHLAWSSDGRFLAFDGADTITLCDDLGTDCFDVNYGTYVADYSENTIIRHVEGTLTNASWSPDSQRLVLSVGDEGGHHGGKGDLVILDVKRGLIRSLTSDSASDLYPAWSPDGEWIAFIRFDPDPAFGCNPFPWIFGDEQCHQGSLYRIRPDGSDLQLLYEPVFINNLVGSESHDAPSWSPDSQWLAFLTSNEDEEYYPDISIVNVETGVWQLLAGEQGPEKNPAWSPDGQKLAFVSRKDGNSDIYLWDMQDKSIANLTNMPTHEYFPVWSVSGAHIAYISDGMLWIMNADGTNRVLIDDEFVLGIPAWQPGVQP